jgi:hypothetical protein
MMVVKQGEVAVIKAYVGLVSQDTSGIDFKFGSLVRPGHRGVWQDPLRTGKYPLNPRCYEAEIVPTAILNLLRRTLIIWTRICNRSSRRATKASFSRSTCRSRSTCPTRMPRG